MTRWHFYIYTYSIKNTFVSFIELAQFWNLQPKELIIFKID